MAALRTATRRPTPIATGLISSGQSYSWRRQLKPAWIQARRPLSDSSATPPGGIPDFAFAFDIDGVLLRAAEPIPGAREALTLLQSENIPFILLTNGGGYPEPERVKELSSRLQVPISTSNFIQSHTPFSELREFHEKMILVLGGTEDKCRHVAENYGFKNVILPADLYVADESLWPFSRQFLPFYKEFAKPLPKPLYAPGADLDGSLKIDAIFVYNDPRDWGLDATLILDLLLSRQGIVGTLSSKNGDSSLPNKGYQQDGQPPLYFSNPDLWWAAKYHLPRLGQGGFREALNGLWTATTGGKAAGVELRKQVIGKPYALTYSFAEGVLVRHRDELNRGRVEGLPEPLKRVYMVGDNPESDIRGGNEFSSPVGTEWWSILVKTGVHREGEPKYRPRMIVKDVYEAVKWALQREGWPAN